MTSILIVEDDIDLVETYTDLLESRDFKVSSVHRAADAIRVLGRVRPDVIILDLNLPGELGVIVISFVRNLEGSQDIKIIVATGYPEIIQKTGYINSKIDGILTKPISTSTLLQAIDDLALSDAKAS
ncbi:MAG: response regulator [Anaerolineae bacterium]